MAPPSRVATAGEATSSLAALSAEGLSEAAAKLVANAISAATPAAWHLFMDVFSS
jgi:hypothetical protein